METLFPQDFDKSKAPPPIVGQDNHHLFEDHFSHWDRIKSHLKESLPPQEFQSWIEPIQVEAGAQENEIVISVPNIVFYRGLLDVYFDKIEHAKNLLGLDKLLIRLEVKMSEQEKPIEHFDIREKRDYEPAPSENIQSFSDFSSEDPRRENPRSFSKSLSNKTNINSNYTFENFVRGPSNQFGLAACLAVAENPGQTYNPLFIYGSTGLGKTHLLHAVGNAVLHQKPNAVITYISSERFMNEMIYCLRFNKMWEFRQKYRFCDVFLVDDIQFISGRETTQEEFFHTFNSLYEARKQIVITSDLFPQDIPDIEDRLRNRFQWGLIADIQPPDVEHRMAILFNKADKLRIKLSDDVALYIANHAKRNVRELEGALHRIAAFASLKGRPIDLDLAHETFQNVLGEPPKRLTVETVQRVVSETFKVRVSDLKSKKRQRALALPRQIAMYLARQLTNASFPEIGEKFGGKDHTTVMHAVRKIEKEKNKDLDLKSQIDALERQIEQLS